MLKRIRDGLGQKNELGWSECLVLGNSQVYDPVTQWGLNGGKLWLSGGEFQLLRDFTLSLAYLDTFENVQ